MEKCDSSFLNNGICDKDCNKPDCCYDLGDCRKENDAIGIHQNDTFDDLFTYFGRKNSNHKAKMIYASMKLHLKYGSRKRFNHPHIPIMINKNIFTGNFFNDKNLTYFKDLTLDLMNL